MYIYIYVNTYINKRNFTCFCLDFYLLLGRAKIA